MNYYFLSIVGGILILLNVVSQATVPRCTDLRATKIQGTKVFLSWTVPTPTIPEVIQELDLRMSTVPITSLNFNSRTRLTLLTDPGTPGSTQSVTISNLSLTTRYYFALKNSGVTGGLPQVWSTMSNLVEATTFGATLPVTLAWDQNPESDVIGYKIYYGIVYEVMDQTVDVGYNTTVEISGLEYDTTYYMMVTAYNTASLESLPSAIIEVTP